MNPGTYSLTRDSENVLPTTLLKKRSACGWIHLAALFVAVGLTASQSAARRLIQAGGAYVNEKRIQHENAVLAWTPQGTYLCDMETT